MCKYCDIPKDKIQTYWGYYCSSTLGRSDKPISKIREDCRIATKDDRYVICFSYDYDDVSYPINFCPFCGRDLEYK